MLDLPAANCRLSFSWYRTRAAMAVRDALRAGPSAGAEGVDFRARG